MLTLALTLHLAATDASAANLSPVTQVRLVEIGAELTALRKDPWPRGAVTLMAVGFGGALASVALGILVGVAITGYSGLAVFIISLGVAALGVLAGVVGLIWGGIGAAINDGRRRELEAQRATILRESFEAPEQLPPPPTMRPQVLNEPWVRPVTLAPLLIAVSQIRA